MSRTKFLAIACLLSLASTGANAVPIQFADNGHWYEYVSGTPSWQDARAAALGSTFMGQSGYLATITSAAENNFVYSLLLAAHGVGGWIGGTDAAVEGNFRWADGPEAGDLFSYTNWESTEPNNCCSGEDYVNLSTLQAGRWNDLGATDTYFRTGYFVEYNAVSEPGAITLLGLGLIGLGLTRRRKKI